MSTDDALRHIQMARVPSKKVHERQAHILNALEEFSKSVQTLEREVDKLRTQPKAGEGRSGVSEI